MTELNNPEIVARAEQQIEKIAGAESDTAIGLLNLWARGYVEALHAEALIDWDEYCRLNDLVDQQRNWRKAELKAAASE